MKQLFYDIKSESPVVFDDLDMAQEPLILLPHEPLRKYEMGLFSVIMLTGGLHCFTKCMSFFVNYSDCKYELLIGHYTDSPPPERPMPVPETTCVQYPEWHYGRDNNDLARLAKGEYLLFINDDCQVITPDWLQKFAQGFRDPDVGMIGCKLIYPDDTIQHAGFGYEFAIERLAVYHRYRGKDRFYPPACKREKVPGVTAACVAVRHQLFDWVGGFDERYRYECQDTDLCIKIIAAGSDILYDGSIELYHIEAATKTPEKHPFHYEEDRRLMNARLSRFILMKGIMSLGRRNGKEDQI